MREVVIKSRGGGKWRCFSDHGWRVAGAKLKGKSGQARRAGAAFYCSRQIFWSRDILGLRASAQTGADILKVEKFKVNNLRVVRVYMGGEGVGVLRAVVRMGGRASAAVYR